MFPLKNLSSWQGLAMPAAIADPDRLLSPFLRKVLSLHRGAFLLTVAKQNIHFRLQFQLLSFCIV